MARMYLLCFSPLFRCDRRFGDDFIVVLAMLFRMTNSDIEPLRLVPINYLVLYVLIVFPPARMSPFLPSRTHHVYFYLLFFRSSLSLFFSFWSVYVLLSRTAREAFRHGLYYVLFVLAFVLTRYSVLSYIHLHTPLIHTSGG